MSLFRPTLCLREEGNAALVRLSRRLSFWRPAPQRPRPRSISLRFHGVAHATVPIESSQRFFQLLRDAKVPAEFHAFAGVAHVFDSQPDLAQVCG